MEFTLPQFSLALPEIFLLGMICVILMVDVFIKDRMRFVTYAMTQGAVAGAFLLALLQFGEYPEPIFTFDYHYVVDKLAILGKLSIFCLAFLPLPMRVITSRRVRFLPANITC